MASREKLIPSLTVDKNGKTTTVYRNPDLQTTGTRGIPAPSMPTARETRQHTIDAVWEVIFEGITKFKLPSYKDKMTNLYRSLSGAPDDAYPGLVLETVQTIVPAAKSTLAVRAVLVTIADDNEQIVRGMHRSRGYLADHPEQIAQFVPIAKAVHKHLDTSLDSALVNIESHLHAKRLFEELTKDYNVLGQTGEVYYRNAPDVIAIVDKHPDHVDELMEFLKRGQEVASISEFEDYLKQGVLREGTL